MPSIQWLPTPTDRSLKQEIEPTAPPPLFNRRRVLMGSLLAYATLATALSIAQIGYINADFVGYATIAHRFLADPHTSITGYWSPLYSWCMAPLICFGIDDLTAGRLVLVAGGAIYLLAVFGLACRFHGTDQRRNRVITVAVMTVAVLQSATWATRMLDPDLLADGLLFCYFYAVLDPQLPQRPFRGVLVGAAAGMASLGKAYMLPFTLVHLTATLVMRWRISRRVGQASGSGLRSWGTTWAAFLIGQAIIAGPWIAVLTAHYGKLTFSTAGAANHANMSPTAFGNDPLWNPGLVADFIADPQFGPNWSALQDTAHFFHQLKVIAYNLNNCLGCVLPWVVFAAIFAVAMRGKRLRQVWARGMDLPTRGEAFPGAWWCVITVALYLGGYSLINLESRYIVPAMTPLLCLGAMLIVLRNAVSSEDRLAWIRLRWRQSAWWVIPVILLVSFQDVSRMARTPWEHPQSASLARFRTIAEQLRGAQILPRTFAADHWHDGLYLSYALGDVPEYLGAPLPNSAKSVMEQLQGSSTGVYLRWHWDKKGVAEPGKIDNFVPAAPWTLVSSIKDRQAGPMVLEVYACPAQDRPTVSSGR